MFSHLQLYFKLESSVYDVNSYMTVHVPRQQTNMVAIERYRPIKCIFISKLEREPVLMTSNDFYITRDAYR